MLTLILFGVLGGLLFMLYRNSMKGFQYWDERNVPVPIKPYFLVGNETNIFGERMSIGQLFSDLYFQTKSLPYFGRYTFRGPMLVLNDLEVIKNVLTKDFIHFSDHNPPLDEEIYPLEGHLFALTGEKWKSLRVKLTPTFTTSKMRFMFETIAACNKEMLLYLNNTVNDINNTINIKELFISLNTDVIGSCAFGIECNSFKDPDAEFLRMGRMRTKQTQTSKMSVLMAVLFPKFFRNRTIPRADKEMVDFFYGIVEKTIKYRTENNVTRNDFMQLIIQLKKDGRVEDESIKEAQHDDGVRLTAMQCAAQIFVFFIAGFETSSTTASFALYELALNPDIQDKLRKDIDQVLQKHDGIISYDALMEMEYLEMVVDETLRKYPPLPVLFRLCTKNYIIPGTNSKIDKGNRLWIPLLGIQRDPEFYPNPNKFDPERFSRENKKSRKNFSYMPFGEGPRICIGNRFGLLQTKLGLVSLISNYEISVSDKTTIPMKFDASSFVLASEGGIWLKLTPRSGR